MITHIVSDWLFSPCCVEHQDEFIFERVAVAYSRDYNEVGRAQIKLLTGRSRIDPWSATQTCIVKPDRYGSRRTRVKLQAGISPLPVEEPPVFMVSPRIDNRWNFTKSLYIYVNFKFEW